MSEEFDKAYWDDRYSDDGRLRHGHDHGHGAGPNPHLVAETGGLTPGTALDAGCGEGAEAHWLAARGWQVTAVDIAEAALRRARAHTPAEADGRIEWRQADLTAWAPPETRFDLVATHYVHTPAAPEQLLARLASGVAPGGTLLFVGHHPADAHRHHVTATSAASLTPEQAAAALDPALWDVAVAEARTRTLPRPDGREVTFHDTVLRARRRA
jgi:2-polyprenyl-3-methyl-5-hydroxy-6-metoxy-1,4-benzoquinol methylase